MGFKFFEKNRMITAGAFCCCLIMVIFPEITARASREAIGLWLNAVVPSLLPFFIAAGFLKKSGLAAGLPSESYPFIMAALSGYPMGAAVAGDCYREGRLSREQLIHVLSCSMVTGPAFLIGAAGVGFLGSHKLGLLLAAGHYGGALLNGVFYGSRGTGRDRRRSGSLEQRGVLQGGERQKRYYDILTDAILDSFRSVFLILAYIVIFTIAGDLLQFSGFLRLMPTPELAALVKGVMEMTVGANSLAVCQCGALQKTALISFVISFGGLSVMGQSMSMLRGCGITLRQIFLMKLSHGILSGILTFTIGCFVV
ncbi:MAG: hypothetical protein ACI4LA_03930 [Emergencia sp.]